MKMHKNYPHFPMLEPKALFGLFDRLKVPSAFLAEQANCTRQSVYRWRRGKHEKVGLSFMLALNEVAYRLLRAAHARKLPQPNKKGEMPVKSEVWLAALDDKNYPKPLGEMSPFELFPQSWWATLGLSPEQPNAAT